MSDQTPRLWIPPRLPPGFRKRVFLFLQLLACIAVNLGLAWTNRGVDSQAFLLLNCAGAAMAIDSARWICVETYRDVREWRVARRAYLDGARVLGELGKLFEEIDKHR
jgi:hypothetical protein